MIDSADYIIVGAGSAGCVLASELSADPDNTVVVIESGPMDKSPLIDMPRGIGKLLAPGNPHVWAYDVHRPGGAKETWLKGHVIGGSSSINGLVYARGFAGDYNRWAGELGCAGWSWADLLPCFKANEHHEFGESEERGVGGPLRISGHPPDISGPGPKSLCEAFLDACDQAGTPRVPDTNNAADGGAGYQPRTIWEGTRQSAAKAFLHPAMTRPNLTVISDTRVERVLFEGTRAVGVAVRDKSGAGHTIASNREVILCGGAIESPKLLQLSGIGPAERLKEAGIQVVADLPQVGQNLREHCNFMVQYRVTRGSLNSAFQGPRLLWNLLRYLVTRSGPLAHGSQEMLAYIKSREGLDRPDCQLGVGLWSLHNGPKGPELDKEPGFTVGGYHMHPRSQGQLYITSADAGDQPHIEVNYLSDPEDQAASVAMVRYIRRIAGQPALKDFIVEEVQPGPDVQSDDEILEAYKTLGATAYHVSGTCRMGSDQESVVDPQTRVRGVDGLRVVDTSIFPELPSGNTNAPAMAAGRRAAQFILEDRNTGEQRKAG
jgi:choline dehydrogenase-like flavoprotein